MNVDNVTDERYSAHTPAETERKERIELHTLFVALRNAILARNIINHPQYSS